MKALIFGATGTAGGSVLRASLDSPQVDEVRVIVRRPLKVTHEKLRVIIHRDFLDYAAVAEAFDGIDACLFCLGISVRQTSGEAEYRTITHDFGLAAARTLRRHSPDAAFHFISGQGTALDSRMMWARVKAETERDLMQEFGAVCWRPAFIDGVDSDNAPRLYQAIRPAFRLLRGLRGMYVAGEDIGLAMIQATRDGERGRIIDNREIRRIADGARAAGGGSRLPR
jgi:uncharacterized protein YbjT (DUF2867 family)